MLEGQVYISEGFLQYDKIQMFISYKSGMLQCSKVVL